MSRTKRNNAFKITRHPRTKQTQTLEAKAYEILAEFGQTSNRLAVRANPRSGALVTTLDDLPFSCSREKRYYW